MKSQEGAQGLMDAVYMNVAGSVCRCLWCDFLSFVTTHLWGLKSFMPQTVSLSQSPGAEPQPAAPRPRELAYSVL